MPEAEFIEKFIAKIDKIDRGSLQNYIQELKNEKCFLHDILDSVSAGILLVGVDGKIKFISRGSKSLLGISHSVSIRPKSSLRDMIQDKNLRDFLTEHIQAQDHVVQQAIEVLTPQHTYLSVSLAPMFDARRNFQGCLILLINTTFSYERERQMGRLQKIDSLTRLAAGIAHEIGNPLNSIGIHLKLLQREIELLPPSTRKKGIELLEIIRSETKSLDTMVRGCLRATRQTPIQLRETDINEVIEDAAAFLKFEMREADVRLQLRLSKTIPPFLIDAQKMRQVFINVIKNAIQSMPDGGKLEITSSRLDKVCSLVFKDEGIGILESDMPHIFESYFTTKQEGSGLGLMIVSDIIQQHNGRIQVKSQVGRGTTFIIHLPMRREKLQLPEKPIKVA